MSQKIYTVQELARGLRVTPNTIRNWIRSGELVAHRFGRRGHWRVTAKELQDFLTRFEAAEDWRPDHDPDAA